MTSPLSSFLPAHLASLDTSERLRLEQILAESMSEALTAPDASTAAVGGIYAEFVLDMFEGTQETRDMVMKVYTEKLAADFTPHADPLLYLRALIAADMAQGCNRYLLGTQFVKYQANKAVAAQGFAPLYLDFWATTEN